MDFKTADGLFRNQKFGELSALEAGRKYLRLRSLSRTKYLARFLKSYVHDIDEIKKKEFLSTAYVQDFSLAEIDKFIKEFYEEERRNRKEKEDALVNELYKLKVFDWGGLHQNSLEKTIVDNYIKKISSFDLIEKKIDTDLHLRLKGYVLCSWYNHWTSILIEDVFKDHSRVIPALGLIGKVDFFIDQVPFDLKVTYLPEGFIAAKRKEQKLRPELTLLKQSARNLKIPIDSSLSNSEQLENLWLKHVEFDVKGFGSIISDLSSFRIELIADIEREPERLIRWLYENQGVRRFDASNRFFILLINSSNFFEGWKMKRSLPLIKKVTNEYLDANRDVGRAVTFDWEGQNFQVISDLLIIKN